ncbi:TSUP family transporter [Nakamurella sp. YIM 132087]|uniref:Probable membrane transporter protein n=1 Tax=Nakamurella alba TaxID=2665158 RepID=A0A7K1FQT8_9ACTN|nr:sulfite exporter TauE/SafE family protein [Nakamurella alba]MTD16508.1 TSUP family transporter [Nakamurella alba]
MTIGEILLLLAAGVGAGIVGSTAGLASLVSYPALLLVGLPPVVANVTNTVGLIGSSIGSVAGSRPELTGQGRTLLRWAPIGVVGGILGAILLLVGSPATFGAIVPFLVAMASVLLLLSPNLRRFTLARRERAVGAGAVLRPDGGPLVPFLLFLGCVYGGYFGAAAGVMILALLLAGTDRTLPVANAIKNFVLGCANAVAAVTFSLTADVDWSAVPPLLVGCVVGGRIGPAVVRRIPATGMRWFIGIAGLALAVKLWIG